MKTIDLYVCEVCGKESRVLATMEEHEEMCKKEQALKIKREKTYKKELEYFCSQLDLDNIQDVINDYVGKMFDDHFDNITINVYYNENASNTHCAPIGGVENWHRKPDLPKGYPGFVGRIKGTYSKKGKTLSTYSGSFGMNYAIPVHTGTGGGGGNTWEYDVTLFLSDFDKLTSRVARMLLELA